MSIKGKNVPLELTFFLCPLYTSSNKGYGTMVRKVILFFLLLAILFCSYIEYDYQNYLNRKKVDTSIVEVLEGLSINYTKGKKVSFQEKDFEYEFSITNLGVEEKSYQIELRDVQGVPGVTFRLLDEKSELLTSGPIKEGTLLNAKILAGETKRYFLKVQNPFDQFVSFSIDTKYQEMDGSFQSVLLAMNEVKENAEEEGLIKKNEQEGMTYYFKGNVMNNYVSFADYLWRVVRINPDQSVKLVLDSTLDSMEPFNDEEHAGSEIFEESHLYSLLQDFYNLHLQEYDRFIASTSYCFDNSILTEEENKIAYLPSYRLFVDHLPTYSCSGSSLPLKIAMLTADEVLFAGASTENEAEYYLKGAYQSSWWTMTPSKKESGKMHYLAVSKEGIIESDIVESNRLFFRPVISLNRRVRVEGMGTLEEPYVILSEQ